MSKHLFIKAGIAASLCVASIPLVVVHAEGETDYPSKATTHVRISVQTSIACSSIGNTTNSTDVNMGELAPGEITPDPFEFIVSGATNSLTGFTVTGTPTNLIYTVGDPSTAPYIMYKYDGMTTPPGSTQANWWITTTELSGVTIADEITLSTVSPQKDFHLGTKADIKSTTLAGDYEGKIEWVCIVQN